MYYSVYVGNYEQPKIPKGDLKKLAELNITGYLFCVNGQYSVLAKSFKDEAKAYKLKELLKQKGFESFVKKFS